MRHLGTVIAAAVVGPLSWILFAAGQGRSIRAFENAPDGAVPDSGEFLQPALVLAAAGILLGLIATLRISPLGAALAGLLYSASYLGLLFNPSMVTNLLDHTPTLAGYEIDLMAPARTGTSLLVGSLMLVAVVSARRWRRWPEPATDTDTALATDDINATAKDRPLGVDGLGLNPPAEAPEPVPAGGSGWAGRSDWARALSGDPADGQGASSWTRQPSR
ncbi:hypothetical protein D7193_26945 [Micromonospora costi]|uniref:Uncharacterized protein n=2 Tax=Micromonospora costi TaxID=1530042 RepID=A0A3A9ZY59_9ACTN|nr:hypothetical protein D7193_26945 [Micromonospora costi]